MLERKATTAKYAVYRPKCPLTDHYTSWRMFIPNTPTSLFSQEKRLQLNKQPILRVNNFLSESINSQNVPSTIFVICVFFSFLLSYVKLQYWSHYCILSAQCDRSKGGNSVNTHQSGELTYQESGVLKQELYEVTFSLAKDTKAKIKYFFREPWLTCH